MKPFRFVTIATSHYCEKVRWAMDLKKVDYLEDPHAPVFHIRAVKKAGGGSTVPTLVTDGAVYKDSSDILHFLDDHAPEPQLYPSDPAPKERIMELEKLCDEVLGTHARRIVYSIFLEQKELLFQMFPEDSPPNEMRWFRFGFPLFRFLVRREYRITPESVLRSFVRVEEVFATIEKQLEAEGDFLVGDFLSAADITFACMSAPVVLPEHYFVKLPKVSDFPGDLQDRIRKLRESPAGLYAQRLFREHRKQ